MIDSNLSWKKQVACVLKKVRRGIGILNKIRHYITKNILKNLYYTLIYLSFSNLWINCMG